MYLPSTPSCLLKCCMRSWSFNTMDFHSWHSATLSLEKKKYCLNRLARSLRWLVPVSRSTPLVSELQNKSSYKENSEFVVTSGIVPHLSSARENYLRQGHTFDACRLLARGDLLTRFCGHSLN